MVLARNRGQHGTHFTSLDVHHDKHMLAKHPSPFFIRETEEQAWQDSNGEWLSFLSPSITVTRKNLFAAVDQVEMLADWIEAHMHRAREWRTAKTTERSRP